MESVRALESDIIYLRQLVGAGWNGVASARHELDGRVFTPVSKSAVWTPTAIGAAVGMLSTGLIGNRRSRSTVAVGGLLGSVVGLGAAAAWSSRGFTSTAARRAARFVNTVRDSRWLAKHPIDYA